MPGLHPTVTTQPSRPRLSCLALLPGGTDPGLRDTFAPLGLRVHMVRDAATARSLLSQFDFDAVVLSVDGLGWAALDLLEALRRRSAAPVLMVGPPGADGMRRAALAAGADDWLTRPAPARSVGLRLHALVAHRKRDRRALAAGVTAGLSASADELCLRPPHGDFEPWAAWPVRGLLHIDRRACRATIDGCRLALSATQLDLLALLASHAGQVLSRVALQSAMGLAPDVAGRRIDTRISRLRAALGSRPGPGWQLASITGRGYSLHWVELPAEAPCRFGHGAGC